jgi:succinoglycan biosynthesis protein ExoA
MTTEPIVSVLIPALDEAEDIMACIDTIGRQTYALSLVEVLLLDAVSVDGTPEAAEAAAARHKFRGFRVLTNPRRRTSVGLNIGLNDAEGDVVVRIDARSRVEPHYIERCVRTLRVRPDVGVVGGMQLAVPRSGRATDIGIARALRNRWASGGSPYRVSRVSRESDTVWMGVFRAAELRCLGGWDESVALNEDFELNARYRGAGFVVWFDASLRSGYIPRRSLSGLVQQHFYFGRVKGLGWTRGMRPTGRQFVSLLLPPTALVGTLVLARMSRSRLVAGIGLALASIVVEATGTDGPPAGPRARAAAIAALVGKSLAWWTGTVVGVVGALCGFRHRHA